MKVEVRMTVYVAVCVVQLRCGVWDDDDERKEEGETRCRFIACSSRKTARSPPGLTSPSDGQIAINSIISEMTNTILFYLIFQFLCSKTRCF